jgi:hypothetical protein
VLGSLIAPQLRFELGWAFPGKAKPTRRRAAIGQMFVYASGLGWILEIFEKHRESKPRTLEIEARRHYWERRRLACNGAPQMRPILRRAQLLAPGGARCGRAARAPSEELEWLIQGSCHSELRIFQGSRPRAEQTSWITGFCLTNLLAQADVARVK